MHAPVTRNLAELAAWVGGTVVGDGRTRIVGAAPLGIARTGDITLADNADKAKRLSDSEASAAVVPRGFTPSIPAIQVGDVHAAFTCIVTHFRPPLARPAPGIHPHTIVSSTAIIADDATILPGAVIGDHVTIGSRTIIHGGVHILPHTTVGNNVTIFPNVVLYEHTVIGSGAIIHAGCVIGAYGFGYKTVEGKHQLSAQLGYVEIGEDVELGACTTIDRGVYGPTVIGQGTKIDNQVQIGHNCQIGRHNLLCSQVGLAGSCTTGDYVVMAGQVGVRDHVHIGHRAMLAAQAGISRDVADDEQMFGTPASPAREEMQSIAIYNRLPELRAQIKALKTAVAMLQAQQRPNSGQAAA
jgi:UDP-3-O-[3-hydroxymyristoyl] glucosamine N-acyltransferase